MAPVADQVIETRMTNTASTRLTLSGVATRNAPSAGPIVFWGGCRSQATDARGTASPSGGKPRPYVSINPRGGSSALAGHRLFNGGYPNARVADGPMT